MRVGNDVFKLYLSCTTPAGSEGTVSLQVISLTGKTVTLENAFTYMASKKWVATSTVGAPSARTRFAAVAAGEKLFVWSGRNAAGGHLEDGAVFDSRTRSWTAVEDSPLDARYDHSAIWTGDKVIVFGGVTQEGISSEGASYDLENKTWTGIFSSDTPAPRARHTAIWTGSVMIVWGEGASAYLQSGNIYNPASMAWSATSISSDTPAPRLGHAALWTGQKMFIWGGQDDATFFQSGGLYDPITSTWSRTSSGNALSGRLDFVAVWTGGEVLIWGGTQVDGTALANGGSYELSTWSALPTPAPSVLSARTRAAGVWTGAKMIIWGGESGDYKFSNGAIYDPSTQTLETISSTLAGTPSARKSHVGIWTGAELLIWGAWIAGLPTLEGSLPLRG